VPRAASTIAGVTRSRELVSRRAVLALLAAGSVAGCSGDADPSGSGTRSPAPSTPSAGAGAGALVWANWPEYIDVAGGGRRRPTLDAFVRRSGIEVDYQEVVNDNEEFVSSIAAALEAGRPVGYDILTLTSWKAAELVRAGWVQPFGPVGNVDHLIPALARPDWDPEQRFSMPWQAGLTGIAYDARRVDRAVGSIDDLFRRRDLDGRIGLLTEFTDSVGMALLAQGSDPSSATVTGVESAVDLLAEQTRAGRFAGYYGNDFIDALADGEVVACLAWSGDVLQAQLRNPYLKFVIPEEGLMIWSDSLIVPSASTQADAVAELAAYFYDPVVAARVAAWVNYICPVVGAQEAMERIDPDLALSPLIFPDTTILDRSYQFTSLPAEDDERLRATFASLVTA
jgi:spermidine/putrescine transport system substrate-binding protein